MDQHRCHLCLLIKFGFSPEEARMASPLDEWRARLFLAIRIPGRDGVAFVGAVLAVKQFAWFPNNAPSTTVEIAFIQTCVDENTARHRILFWLVVRGFFLRA